MGHQADRLSIASGSTFDCSSQRTASLAPSSTSIYSQEAYKPSLTTTTQHTHSPRQNIPRAQTAPCPPGGAHPTNPHPSIARPRSRTRTSSTETLVAAPLLGERYWNDTTPSPGGQRTEIKTPRGVISPPGANASNWQCAIESVLQYHFRNPDLLEEALESPGSGVIVVGTSHRVCADGNEGLARVGKGVMKLLLNDQCYLYRIPNGDRNKIIDRILGWRNLNKLGRRTNIEKMIRPKKQVRASRKNNPFHLLVDDAKREDPSRTIMRGIFAIIGAVYYDGDFPATKRVMSQLGLIIKPPVR